VHVVDEDGLERGCAYVAVGNVLFQLDEVVENVKGNRNLPSVVF